MGVDPARRIEGQGLPSDFDYYVQCTVPTRPEVLHSCRELAHSQGPTGAGSKLSFMTTSPLTASPHGDHLHPTTSNSRHGCTRGVRGTAVLADHECHVAGLGKAPEVAQNPIRSRSDAGRNPLRTHSRLSVIDDSMESHRDALGMDGENGRPAEYHNPDRHRCLQSFNLDVGVRLVQRTQNVGSIEPSTICSCDLHSKSRDSALQSRDLLKLPGPALRSKRAQACR